MPVTIKHRFEIDEGTKTVEPMGGESYDFSDVGNEPTGAAESTLVREVTATEHTEGPTGAADTSPGESRSADWPVATTTTETKTTATRKKTTDKATVRRAKSTRGKK